MRCQKTCRIVPCRQGDDHARASGSFARTADRVRFLCRNTTEPCRTSGAADGCLLRSAERREADRRRVLQRGVLGSVGVFDERAEADGGEGRARRCAPAALPSRDRRRRDYRVARWEDDRARARRCRRLSAWRCASHEQREGSPGAISQLRDHRQDPVARLASIACGRRWAALAVRVRLSDARPAPVPANPERPSTGVQGEHPH